MTTAETTTTTAAVPKIQTKTSRENGVRHDTFLVDGREIGCLSVGKCKGMHWYCWEGNLDAPSFLSLECDIGEGWTLNAERARAKANKAIKAHLAP